MDLVRLTDWLFIAGVTIALSIALLRGYRAATHPYLWLLIGTSIFLHVGSIRDFAQDVLYVRSEEYVFRLIEAVHLGFVALGYWIAAARRTSAAKPHPRAHTLLLGRFALVLLTSLALKLYFSNPFSEFNPDVSNHARLLANFSLPAGCLAIAMYEQYRPRLRGALKPIAAVLALLILLGWSFGGSRTPVTYALTCAFGYLLWRNRHRTVQSRWVRRLIVLLLPAISLSLVVVGSFIKGVSTVYRQGRDVDVATQGAIEHGRNLSFIDAYQNGLFAFRIYPDYVDFRWGESLGALFFGFVPRSAWPNKPFGFSYYLTAEKLGPHVRESGLSLATSFLGDMWACGGLASVAATSLLFGVWMGHMQHWRDTHLESVSHQVIFWLFLFLCMLAPRGDIYTVFQRGGSYIVLAAIICVISRRLRERSISAIPPTPTTFTASAQHTRNIFPQ